MISEKRRLLWDGRGAAHGRHRSLQGLPKSIDQFGGLGNIRRVQKEIRCGGVFPRGQFFQPDGEHRLVLLHVVAADKSDHWVMRGHDGVDRHFRFFTLSFNDGFAMGDSAVHRSAIEDYTFLMIHLFNLFATHHKPHAKSNFLHTIFYKNSIGW